MHLTEQDTKSGDSTVGGATLPAGAPEHEIPLTPAAVEAGVEALRSLDERFNSPQDVVVAVFRAIEAQLFHRAS